jgi:hypothetical protein
MPATSNTKYVVMASWDDAPHLTEEQKEELWEGIPPHQRDARSKGIPQLGSGAIYPVIEERITVDDFEIPDFWPRAYALDVGWNCTACLWGAWDRQSDTVFLYSCYKQGQAEPPVHVDAIQSRGKWIPGVIDPAARGRSQRDGQKLYDDYLSMGLNLDLSDNAVEAGIHSVFRRMVSGRLKIFKSMGSWFEEYRLYRRDEKGKIVKENDHLMDCMRYLILSGMMIAVDEITATSDYVTEFKQQTGRNATTGY